MDAQAFEPRIHDIVGRTLIGQRPQSLTVVGVAPAGFAGVWPEAPVDLGVPLMMQHDVRAPAELSARGDSQACSSRGFRRTASAGWIIIGRAPAGDDGRT